MKTGMNLGLILAAVAWAVAFAWFVVHLLRAPLLVEEPATLPRSDEGERAR